MKKAPKKLIFTITCIVFISLFFLWFKEFRGFQKIEDVSISQSFQYKTDSKYVNKYLITIKGEVNGSFTLNEGFDFEAGKIDRVIRSDWYHNEIEITYNPIDVTEGHLKIKIELY